SVAGNTGCGTGQVCAAVSAASAQNATMYAAFRYIPSGMGSYQIRILKSSNGGSTWTTSLAETDTGTGYRPAISLTASGFDNILISYAKYDNSNLFYRFYNGTAWLPEQTVAGAGLSTNTFKQLSSNTNEAGSAYISFTNVTNTLGGMLKVANFMTNGTFLNVETADSTKRHFLPNVIASPNGDININSISGGLIFDTRKSQNVWASPFNPYGTSFSSANELTAGTVLDGMNAAIWEETSGSTVSIKFGLLEHGFVDSSTIQQSPRL